MTWAEACAAMLERKTVHRWTHIGARLFLRLSESDTAMDSIIYGWQNVGRIAWVGSRHVELLDLTATDWEIVTE